jgi:hypothetical protein
VLAIPVPTVVACMLIVGLILFDWGCEAFRLFLSCFQMDGAPWAPSTDKIRPAGADNRKSRRRNQNSYLLMATGCVWIR